MDRDVPSVCSAGCTGRIFFNNVLCSLVQKKIYFERAVLLGSDKVPAFILSMLIKTAALS